MTQVLTCRQVGGLGRCGGDSPGKGGRLNSPSHNVLHKHGSANQKPWFLSRAIVLNHLPQINKLLTKLFLLIVPIKKMSNPNCIFQVLTFLVRVGLFNGLCGDSTKKGYIDKSVGRLSS